jgi:hypothetical protein
MTSIFGKGEAVRPGYAYVSPQMEKYGYGEAGDEIDQQTIEDVAELQNQYTKFPERIKFLMIQKATDGLNPVQKPGMMQAMSRKVDSWLMRNTPVGPKTADAAGRSFEDVYGAAGLEIGDLDPEISELMGKNLWNKWSSNKFKWPF